jgi:hypothetical protein
MIRLLTSIRRDTLMINYYTNTKITKSWKVNVNRNLLVYYKKN